MNVLKQTSLTKQNLSLLIRIDNFPFFVSSKAEYHSRCIVVNKIRWFISMDLRQHFTLAMVTSTCASRPNHRANQTLWGHTCAEMQAFAKIMHSMLWESSSSNMLQRWWNENLHINSTSTNQTAFTISTAFRI